MKRIICIAYLLTFSLCAGAQLPPHVMASLKDSLARATDEETRFSLDSILAFGYRFSNIDSSLHYTDRALERATRLHKETQRAAILSLKGATLLEIGRIPESLALQLEAIRIGEQNNNAAINALAYNRIGNIYMELADYPTANEYYFLSRDICIQIGGEFGRSFYFNELSNIGNVYELMGMPDSALHYLNMALDSVQRSHRDFLVVSELYFRLGNAYKLKGDTARALDYYKQGIRRAIATNDSRQFTVNSLLLGRLYRDMRLPDSSFNYAYQALYTGRSVSFRKGIYESSLLLSELYKSKGRYDSSLFYLETANEEKEYLTGTRRFQELQRIILNDQETARKKEIQRIAERNKQRQIALLTGLAAILIVATLLYHNNRQKQKTNRKLETALTRLKATQSQLIQSEKMASLGELTAGIAHEIQNPLNFVNNFSELNTELIDELKQELTTGNWQLAKELADNIRENEEKISQHGKRADAIVKGMLQHSRSSSGKKEPTDINALCDEYLRLAYHGLRAKDKSFNAKFETDLDPSIGPVNVLPQDLGRVILNLINNAFYAVSAKASAAAGGDYAPTVTVSTRKSDDKVKIEIRDNGTGIPQKVIDKIFQPFFTTKPTGQGTGLGLSLSYDIVTKAHGGQLTVESREGEFTCFTIVLPV